MPEIEDLDRCPACGGEVDMMYGMGGGGETGEGVGIYWICLECPWTGGKTQRTVCFPHGLVREPTGA